MLLFKCDLIIPNTQNYFCLATKEKNVNLLWKKNIQSHAGRYKVSNKTYCMK